MRMDSCARREVIGARRCNGGGEMASICLRGNRGLKGARGTIKPTDDVL